MAKVYTKTGDCGMTSLIGGKRISKSHPIIEIIGTLDELSAFIAVLHDVLDIMDESRKFLMHIQSQIFKVEAYYASELLEKYEIESEEMDLLEGMIDKLEAKNPAFNEFVILGGNLASSYANVCRTVCRRAERLIVKVDTSSCCLKFINRLSDYFFELSRGLL